MSEAERLTLESWAERRSTDQGLAVRARIVPACANGWNNTVAAGGHSAFPDGSSFLIGPGGR
ncbi:hypothetical protein [Streptomyces umbrinus]|uniref:hypothetical protein n=1 Tax=Streptomyces umbrinus TaxID=67370 RepID=UPI0033EAD9C3